MARALYLADVLRKAGLKVVEVDGWKTRGADALLPTEKLLWHHTATSAKAPGNLPTLRLLVNGRSDLPGPLSQLAVGRDGTWYVIASGKANHAGKGEYGGTNLSNKTLGVEVEHDGKGAYTAEQYDACVRGFLALCKHLKLNSADVCGHKEWALPRGRKVDPKLDMAEVRRDISSMAHKKKFFPPKAKTVSAPKCNPYAEPKRVLKMGLNGEDVKWLQHELKIPVDGGFGPNTNHWLVNFQKTHGLTADGLCGPATVEELRRT